LPVYNESENISYLYKELIEVLSKYNKYNYEFIFINDGSNDDSLEKLVNIQSKDKRIVVINFSRNFGHQMAITAGMDYAAGEAVVIMDSDLQDPPKVSIDLIKKWEEGYEVVYAQRLSRKDNSFKKITAKLFYKILNKLTDIEIPEDTGDFRLIDRKVVNELKNFREQNRFMRGLVSYVGFKQTAVLFDRDDRHAGKSSYTLRKMIKFAIDGIFSFSSTPLKIISRLGGSISVLSIIGIIYALIMKIFYPDKTVPGWTLLIITVLFIGGLQLLILGVLGSYIGRIYTESQHRPLYIISSILSEKNNAK